MRNPSTLALAALLVAACSKGPQPPAAPPADEPPASFGVCAACHKASEGAPDGLGPNLWGTYGRKAASGPGFKYSPALAQSGLTWDDATLDAWLEAPMTLVPGNRMSFAGIKDPARRAELISWLKTRR